MTTKKTLAKGKSKQQARQQTATGASPQSGSERAGPPTVPIIKPIIKEAPAPIFDDKTKPEPELIFKDAVGKSIPVLSAEKIEKKLEVNRITFNQFLNLSKDELFKRNRFFYAVPK